MPSMPAEEAARRAPRGQRNALSRLKGLWLEGPCMPSAECSAAHGGSRSTQTLAG